MEERWLFLGRRSRKDIESFAFSLTEELGNYWDFSKFEFEHLARQPLQNYSLEKCFEQEKKMVDVKLVIGQEMFSKPSIRFAFRHVNVWADYIKDYSDEDYQKVSGVFQRVFKLSIEEYRPQHILNQEKRSVRIL